MIVPIQKGEYYDRYNTDLGILDKIKLAGMLAVASIKNNRNIFNDYNDYDLKAAYADDRLDALLNGQHGADKYKKPNHPTFSTESKYNGVNGNVGGVWNEQDGQVTFTPSKTNIKNNPNLQEYFNKYEPDVKLIMPAHIVEFLRSGLGNKR